ncbi:thymidylate synthase [Roseicella sp. DB1501]|uniref:thymidylate synthase n=1 Tax=Roseicella sp. DB1501 TaxID=2730925 RepID=UPI001490A033|nr:thymidylate synthase [Roseicella sp. DB1501]
MELSDPRARFSRTEDRGALISFLGETLWYLSGSDSLTQIEYYIPAYRTFINASQHATRAPGAYGPRLFGGGESSQMSKLLKTMVEKRGKSDTRQAVAQIFDRKDLKPGNGDVPCTTTLQFLPRRGKLHLSVTMRSNDIYRGFPGDVFAFTFIQELAAKQLGLELGTYSHYVGSLHLYDDDQERARDYLAEGMQTPMSMPAMPAEDPKPSVAWLLKMEKAIRCGLPKPDATGIDGYWLDLARLLQVKVLYRQKDLRQLVHLKGQMASPVYDAYMRGRQLSLQQKLDVQPVLPGIPPAAAA